MGPQQPPPPPTIVRWALHRLREVAAVLAAVAGCGLLFLVAFEFAVKGGCVPGNVDG